MFIRYISVLIVLLISFASKGQIVQIQVTNNRSKLADAVEYINSSDPAAIAIIADLDECYETDEDKQLSIILEKTDNLIMPSRLRKYFNEDELRDFTGCSYLYPHGVLTGFVNIISDEDDAEVVQYFQITNTFKKNRLRYHMAILLSMLINETETKEFIADNNNITAINLNMDNHHKKISISDFYNGTIERMYLKGKVIVLEGVDEFDKSYLIMTGDKSKKMSLSDIIVSIAVQICGANNK